MPKLKNHPKTIDAAGAVGGKPTRYIIDGVPGLMLECRPDGARSWYARYSVGRGRDGRIQSMRRIGSFDPDAATPDHLTFKQAREKAYELQRSAHADGRDPLAPATGATFNDLFNSWLERHAKVNKRSWKNDEGRWNNHIKVRLGATVATELKRRDLISALDGIAEDVSGVTANRCQSVISAVLNWAADEELIEQSPAHRIRKRGKESQRERVLTDDEAKALWAALTDSAIDRTIKALWLLGQRRTETALATDVDLRNDGWHIPSALAKNGLPHIVPLTDYTRALMRGRGRVSPGEVSHRMQELATDLELDDFRLHDLRHCVATGMAGLGIPRDIRERVMNQITGRKQSIGARYDQFDYLDERRRALELWRGRLLGIVEGREAAG